MKNQFHSRQRVGVATFVTVVFCGARLFAQPDSDTTNVPLKLLPPYGELPPTFGEQHATLISFAGLGLLALIAFALRQIFRPKPEIIIPPEVQAREALENLRRQPEDGAVLSRVSQVVRHYFSAAFQLSPGELTTTEFCREISGREKVGAELSNAAANFLRECDARKFSATPSAATLDAANQALNLVARAEQRRAQLRQLAEPQTPNSRA